MQWMTKTSLTPCHALHILLHTERYRILKLKINYLYRNKSLRIVSNVIDIFSLFSFSFLFFFCEWVGGGCHIHRLAALHQRLINEDF